MKCRFCRTRLDPILEDVGTHPMCEPVIRVRTEGEQLEMKFTELHPGEDPDAVWLKGAILDVVHFADKRNPRSLQVNVGPSELSSLCDRRIGYRLSGTKQVNTTLDPWPAIVGTAVHDWLENAFKIWIAAHASGEWITETRLSFSDWVTGRSDLFNISKGMVVDYKGTSPDRMKKIKEEGSPETYKRQIQIYGWGYQKLGYTVNKVALAYFPRAGNIKDLHTEVFDFDPEVGPTAVARIPEVAARLLDLDVLNQPHRWEQMEAVPSHDCGFCPWYNPRRSAEEGASDLGCPGTRD
jgi:hypothetical protein